MKIDSRMRQSLRALILVFFLAWAVPCAAGWDPGLSGSMARDFLYNDPYHVPLSPGDDGWFSYEGKSALENRDEIALAVDPTDGAKAQAVRDRLAAGGRVVLAVGGYTGWGTPSEWMRPVSTYANDNLDAVVLQVNYQDALSAWYIHSFKKGVDRTTMLVLKARKAGAGKVRIYGHSQGSDVTARVVAIMASPLGARVHRRNLFSWWRGQGNPDWFEGGFAFGNPAGLGVGGITVTSYAAAPPDDRGRRGGFYRYEGEYHDFYYGGKLVLFNRASDPATYGGIPDVARIGLSNHNYIGVFSDPDFMAAFEAALDPNQTPANTFDPAYGDGAYVDREAGERFDFTDSHYIPFIPRADGKMHCTVTVSHAAPNTPVVDEIAHVLVRFYDFNGEPHHDEEFVLAENAARDIADPLTDTWGSAVIYSNEPLNAVVHYSLEDASRYFVGSYPSEAYPSRTLYLPFVAKGWLAPLNHWRQTTEIVLFNPSQREAFLEVTYYKWALGGEGATHTVSHRIPARGSIALSSTELPAEWRSPEGWGVLVSCVIRSTSALAAMVRNRIGRVGSYTGTVYKQYSESSYRAFASRGQGKVYVPMIVDGEELYASRLFVQNTGNEEVTFRVRYLAGEGSDAAEGPPEDLAPGAMRVLYLPDFAAGASSLHPSSGAGSAVIEVQHPAGKGTVAAIAEYSHPSRGAQSHEGIPDGVSWSQQRPDVVDLPFIRDERWPGEIEWHTAIHVVNMGAADDDARIHFHAPDGRGLPIGLTKRVASDSVVTFRVNEDLPDYLSADLLAASGKVEGSREKRLGATVSLTRVGEVEVHDRDLLLGYSAWW